MAAKPLAERFRTCQTGPYPLGDSSAFEFCNGPQNVHLELGGWSGRVDAFRQADEGDAERLKFLQQRDQVLEVASKPIQPPAHHHIEAPSLRVTEDLIERRPTILRPTHPTVMQ